MFQPRTDVIKIFASFAQFEEEIFVRWMIDEKLRRSMESCLRQASPRRDSAEFWALYWYKQWQSSESTKMPSSLVRNHLIAYLQEPCYRASEKAIANFPRTKLTLPDCFQLAMAQVDTIFRGFQADQGFNLKSYAIVIFANFVKENLRQNHEIHICSPWALLRKVSQKRLVESLQNQGLTPNLIAKSVLAWQCYKTIYFPSDPQASTTRTRQLPEPDLSVLTEMATLYKQLHSQSETISPEKLKYSLLAAAEAIRKYLYPRLDSLNTPIPGQESQEFQDYLPASDSDSLLSDLIAIEEEQTRTSQRLEIAEFLRQAISQLPDSEKQLLQLYYQENLRQQEIAARLNTKQYSISRKLSRIRQGLLLKLAQWTQTTLHISLTKDLLSNISQVLEEWLASYYGNPENNSQ